MGTLKVWDGSIWQTMASQGAGVAPGGTINQLLVKNSSANYDTAWSSATADTSGNVRVTTLALGTAPAATGTVRMSSGGNIVWRNAANTAEVGGLAAGDGEFGINHSAAVVLRANGVNRFVANPTGISFFTAAPVAQNTGWSAGSYTALKSFNPQSATLDEALRMIATLVDTLKGYGLLG